MKFEDGKYIPETAEEQQFFDYAFNKGVGQGKKTATKVEEPKPELTPPAFDPSAIAQMIAEAVGAAVKPLQDNFTSVQEATRAAVKDKVIARQTVKLPKAYEALIEGGTEAEVKASFDKVSAQYKQEMQDAGVAVTFGAPTPGGASAGRAKPAKSFKEMTPTEKIELYKESPELYAQLKEGK